MPFDGATIPPVAALLIKGRAKLEIGWCQGTLKRGNNFCMTGALMEDCGSLFPREDQVCGPHFGQAMYLLSQVIPGCPSIPHWNDRMGRTQKQVLAVYDKAIELAFQETTVI